MLLFICFALAINALIGIWRTYHVIKNTRTIENAYNAAAEFFTAEDPTNGSPFNQVIGGVSDLFAHKVGTTIFMASKGSAGGTMKKVNQDLEQVALEQQPELGILDMLPKSTKKNPVAMLGLQYLISQRKGSGSFQGSLFGPAPSNGHHDEYQGRKHRE